MIRLFALTLTLTLAAPSYAAVADLERLRQAEVYTQPGQAPEVASAGRAFEQLSANVAAEKQADRARLSTLYNTAPKRPMALQSAPEPAAAPVAQVGGAGVAATTPSTPVRVLQQKGRYSKVRDTEGNEGWVPSDSL